MPSGFLSTALFLTRRNWGNACYRSYDTAGAGDCIFYHRTCNGHAHGGRMALVKPVKNMLAVRITVSEACMAKQLLQLRGRYCCGAHDLLFISASKGDTMAARFDCCKCR